MKLIHTADIHACREHWAEACQSLDVLEETGRREEVGLFAIAGDLANGPLMNTERDIFDALCGRLQRLADIAPVALVEGTPSHDAPGSLEVFERLAAENEISILRPGQAYFLAPGGIYQDPGEVDDRLLLFGIPEPQKKWLLANGGATGKDATDEAVRVAMGNLLLGLGGLRRQYPHLPCVALYHGQVSGARTGTGYTAGSGIAISRDDLAQIDADYYALGDIHLPQQIPHLEAYYPGKIYTGDWKEQGYVPGFNLVEFRPWEDGDEDPADHGYVVDVSRVDFPHPERVKIARRSGDDLAYNDYGVGDKLVWEEWTLSREEAEANFDAAEVLKFLIDACGALPDSMVTLNIIPTETVRAGNIAEKPSLRGKAQVWAENSAITLAESVLAKADALEREVGAIAQLSGPPRRFRNVSTFLRGSKGLYRRQKKDEVFIDWESYGEGVVAFVGPNGFGKTTLFDFSKPWPVPVSRRPKTLKAHFRLRDSVVENVYLEEVSGIRYKTTINIDGANKSGGAEYFLFIDEGKGWKPVEGVNGRQDPFLEAIESIFGSMAIYLRTAYVPQKPTKDYPDIAEASQEEKKGLIAELAGKDFSPYQDAAKARGDGLDSEIRLLEASITGAGDIEGEITRATAEKTEAESKRAAATNVGIELAVEEGRLEAVRDHLAEKVAARRQKIDRKEALAAEVQSLLAEVRTAEESIALFRDAAERKDAAEADIERIKDLEVKKAELLAERSKLTEADWRAMAAYQETAAAARDRQGAARSVVDARRREVNEQERALAVARSRVPSADPTCPVDGEPCSRVPVEALQKARADAEAEVTRLEGALAIAQGLFSTAEADLAAIIIPTAPPPTPFVRAEELAGVENELAWEDKEAAEKTLADSRDAGVRIEAAEKAKAAAQERATLQQLEVNELTIQISADASPDEYEKAIAAVKENLERLTAAREAFAHAKATVEAAERSIAEAKRRRAARDEAARKRDEKALERDDWRLLERAIEGVRDLELDVLAPSIADIATRLLQSSGDDGHIEIETTRIGSGSAKKAKQIEDFLVFYVAQDGERQDIATCSGGEMVWQRKALYDAFAVMRSRNAGIRFTTGLLDETDGALHPKRKMDYFRMLEASHRESERFQTILITQDAGIAAMASSVIDVAALGPRSAEAAKESAA